MTKTTKNNKLVEFVIDQSRPQKRHDITGFDAPGLRVGDIPEDEDLLNVALWEERATKQWCHLTMGWGHEEEKDPLT